MAKTIIGTIPAYISAKYARVAPAALHAIAASGDQNRKEVALSAITATAETWAKESGDYIPIGRVEMILTLDDTEKMVGGQISALQAQKKKVLAEARVEANRIEDMISKLQALTFEA
jgi:hypothetical protein